MSKQWQLNHPGTGSYCLHFNSVNDNIVVDCYTTIGDVVYFAE
jgi:hypothetical protein